MSEKKTLLKVENATMQFGGVVAVDNLNLEVNEGEIVALIGPNGAGKTTAFNVITGVYAPSNGRITFDGECIVRNHPTGKMKKLYKGKHPTMYTAQFAPEEMLDDASLEVWKAEQKARDEFAFTDRILEPTPDKITDRGMARTFQNIRLWKTQTVFDNVLIAKHMRRSSGFFSATFRGNRKEEAKQREEVLELSYTLLRVTVLVGCVLMVFSLALVPLLFRPVIFPLFKLYGETASIATALAVTGFASIPLHAYSITAVTGVLRAGGDVFWSAALDIGPQWLAALPLTAALALVLQSNYWLVAAAIQMESVIKVPLCLVRVHRGKWIHDVTKSGGDFQ